jgi:TRAP-type uncharacterized transport system fused permease subunit
VSPPVGLSPSAAAAVTGGNPFSAMMQAWKYSLPAFLVPFFFSATLVGANLLIVGATWGGFIEATLTAVLALLFLSIGIIGFFRGGMHRIERAILIVIACVMVLDPIDLSPLGLLPVAIALLVVARNHLANRPITKTV